MLLASLSAAQKAGIAGMGAAFIVFALVSSFVVPRYRPNVAFLGALGCWAIVRWESVDSRAMRRSPVVLFASAFLVLLVAACGSVGTVRPLPQQVVGAIPKATVSGKQVFAANGCAACHTFKPAGANGTVGPDLDHLAADATKANRGSLVQYATESIVDPSAYVVPGFLAGTMPQDFAKKLSKKQIQDLVAFLLKPS